MVKVIAYIVEIDGKTYYVNDIDKTLFHFKFTLSEYAAFNRFDQVYLERNYKWLVARSVKKQLLKKFIDVKFYAVRDNSTKEEL